MYKKTLKVKAHAFTLISAFWLFFSGFAVMDWLDVHRALALNPSTVFDFCIWGLHLVFISVALYFWQSEQPRSALYLGKEVWHHIATHLCVWILFANLPLFAFLQGSFAVELIVHGLLLSIGMGGFVLLNRTKKTTAKAIK